MKKVTIGLLLVLISCSFSVAVTLAQAYSVGSVNPPIQDVRIPSPPTISSSPLYISYRGEQNSLKLYVCNLPDCSGYNTSPRILRTSGFTQAQYADLALSTDNLPLVAFTLQDTNPSSSEIYVAKCGDVNCTPALIQEHHITVANPQGSSTAVTNLSLGVDAFNMPVVSYYDPNPTSRGLKFIRCLTHDCSSYGLSVTVNTLTSGGQTEVLTKNIDLLPIIAYIGNGDLKFVHCTSYTCNTHDFPRVLDGNGTFTHFGIDFDVPGGYFQPTIAYYESTSRELRLIQCTDFFCGDNPAPTPRVLDVIPVSGTDAVSSLVFGADHYPVISYAVSEGPSIITGLFQAIHCTSSDCSTTDPKFLLDSKGGWNAITKAGDDRAVMSYDDIENDVLKFIHCRDIACALFDEPRTLDAHTDAGESNTIISP